MDREWSAEIRSQALYRLDESSRMAFKCLEGFTDEEIWRRLNAASNSVGNLILHLCGNMSQYIIASLGESQDIRDRELEFSCTSGYSGKQLAKMLQDTLEKVKAIIEQCTAEKLLKVRKVQGFELTGVGIIIHDVEHYSYHVGQIVFWSKILKEKHMGFYDGVNLNIKNEA